MNEQEVTSLLEELGLTEYEAKTLTALFVLDESEAPDISRKASVPKTRVYDVLDRLTKRGLIIEIYGRPKKYKVVDPDSVFNDLISQKKNQIVSLEERALKVKEVIVQTNGHDETAEKVMKVKDKADFMKILSQEIDKAQDKVLAFTASGKEYGMVHESLKNASGKKVDVKVITHVPEDVKHIIDEYETAGVNVKNMKNDVHAYVLDDKKVILALSDFKQDRPEYHFTIWNNNQTMANVLSHYFENCWNRSGKPGK